MVLKKEHVSRTATVRGKKSIKIENNNKRGSN